MEQTPAPELPPSQPGRGRLAPIVGGAAIAAVIGAFLGVGGLDLVVPQDPHEQATEEAGRRLSELPGFDARFGDLDEQEAFDQGIALGLAAVPRLSDAELDEWLTITGQILGAIDEEACAMFARGPGDAERTLQAFQAVDIAVYRRYIDLIISGARRELSDAPADPLPAQAEYDAALALLVEQLGVDRLGEIGIALSDPATASDSTLCGALRDFYGGVAQLDRGARLTLMRSILATAGSP